MSVLAVRRDGFDGPIELSVSGLPNGVRWSGSTIPENSTGSTLLFEADRRASAWAGTIQVAGQARIGNRQAVRQAHHASLVWDVGGFAQKTVPSRIVRNLAMAVSQLETAPQLPQFEIAQQRWDLPLEGDLKIPFTISQRSSLPGEIKLRLRDLPGLRDSTTNLVLDEKTSEGVLEFRLTTRGNDLRPGQGTFSAVGVGEVTYRRQLDALARAGQEYSRMQQVANRYLAEARRTAESESTSPNRRVESSNQARAAERERRKADRCLREASERARPRKVRVAMHSRALDLQIHPAPVVLAAASIPKPLKPGSSFEVPVSIERQFDYQDVVQINLVVPVHVVGVQAAPVAIPKGESRAVLAVQLAPDLPAGEYPLKLQAKLQLNERDLQVEQPLVIQVRPDSERPPASELLRHP